MFTGLVQAIGEVQAVEPRGTGVRLRVGTGLGAEEPWVLGESVAVNGACLTVCAAGAWGFAADVLGGDPLSFPGYTLSVGSRGEAVRTIQEQLNVISDAYPLIPKVAEDGIFGPATAEAVRTFQEIFGYPENGSVDFNTWYRISAIYVGVSRIAEYM